MKRLLITILAALVLSLPAVAQAPQTYPSIITAAQQQPTLKGSLEYNPSFRKQANLAMSRVHASEAMGGKGEEAGFVVPRVGEMGGITYRPDNEGNRAGMSQNLPSDSIGALHTHDKYHVASPSKQDQAAARKSHSTIWVTSRGGLYSVDPNGNITQAFNSPTWATDKEPK